MVRICTVVVKSVFMPQSFEVHPTAASVTARLSLMVSMRLGFIGWPHFREFIATQRSRHQSHCELFEEKRVKVIHKLLQVVLVHQPDIEIYPEPSKLIVQRDRTVDPLTPSARYRLLVKNRLANERIYNNVLEVPYLQISSKKVQFQELRVIDTSLVSWLGEIVVVKPTNEVLVCLGVRHGGEGACVKHRPWCSRCQETDHILRNWNKQVHVKIIDYLLVFSDDNSESRCEISTTYPISLYKNSARVSFYLSSEDFGCLAILNLTKLCSMLQPLTRRTPAVCLLRFRGEVLGAL